MARRNLLRSWLAAALSIVAVMAAGLLTVRPMPAGAADPRYFEITVSDAGFNPPVVSDVIVGDVLIFKLYATTDQHKIIFEDNSICPGRRGAVPCWPELRFDDSTTANCWNGQIEQDWRCLIVQDPGKTVPYYDGFNVANRGEIRVLGQPTTTTGPSTTTTTAPPTTTTTQGPTTTTTRSGTTTTTAPTQLRPFVIPNPPSTTSTTGAPAPVVVTNTSGSPAPAATRDKANDKDSDKDKGKAKAKAAGTETPTSLSPPPSDAMPPDSVFDPAALTPGPGLVPVDPNPNGNDEVNLESAAVMNLLDRDEPADRRPLLLALGALALLLTLGGIWRWFTGSSRYDPA